MSNSSIRVSIQTGDALSFQADVLVLKHAQGLFGVDAAAYAKLTRAGVKGALPATGAHLELRSQGILGTEMVVFIGVEALSRFDYNEIRVFGRRAVSTLAMLRQSTRHIAVTVHGPGYGLDETESFESEFAGMAEAISNGDFPEELREITFVELDPKRSERLTTVLTRLLPGGELNRTRKGTLKGLDQPAKQTLRTAGKESANKAKVFVAMPFADEMSDVFHYGIQNAANSAGLLAERADLAAFTGDIMEWVRGRISSASLMIADLTTTNANVFLEVGYAWGRGVPTVLVVREGTKLPFNTQGQRCLVYTSIKDLEQKLSNELISLDSSVRTQLPT